MSSQQEDAAESLKVKRPPVWKILVVGDNNAGKTSLLTRYSERTFCNHAGGWIGIDFRIGLITIDEVVYKLHIWDTWANERWGPRGVSSTHYRGVKAVILVYDITNRHSYENLMGKWIMGFRIHTAKSDHKVLPVIVGSKLDLYGQRQVFREEAEAYARSIGALFYETSARTGENVDQIFEQTTRRLIAEGIPPFIYEEWEADKKRKADQKREADLKREADRKQDAENEPKGNSCILS